MERHQLSHVATLGVENLIVSPFGHQTLLLLLLLLLTKTLVDYFVDVQIHLAPQLLDNQYVTRRKAHIAVVTSSLKSRRSPSVGYCREAISAIN